MEIQPGDDSSQMQSAYSMSLQQALKMRQDIVLDFTNLKACLDPLAEYATQNAESNDQNQQTQFDYKSFLRVYLDNKSDEPFPQLASLTVRNLTLPVTTLLETDESAETMYRLMQFENLVEFDISGVRIPAELQSQLQFWNMHNLKKLCLDCTDLKSVPSSIGRLRNLEVLSLNSNALSDLPITLGFCQKLNVLNLKANRFTLIPGVVLKLMNLKDLRRLDNPLVKDILMRGAPPADTATVHNPTSLQSLCTRAVFVSHIDYWEQENLGPLQCKTLDYLASSLFLCDRCGTVISQEYKLDISLFAHLGLRDVPFRLRACSATCQTELVSHYREKNAALQRECDEEYERTIRLAHEGNAQSPTDMTVSTTVGPFPSTTPQRRRHKRCLIL